MPEVLELNLLYFKAVHVGTTMHDIFNNLTPVNISNSLTPCAKIHNHYNIFTRPSAASNLYILVIIWLISFPQSEWLLVEPDYLVRTAGIMNYVFLFSSSDA